MKKIVFLDSATVGQVPELEMLSNLGKVILYPFTEPNDTMERIIDADIILTNKVVINESHLKNCKNLKLICVTATGTNNIDLKAAANLEIKVVNAVGYAAESVAQYTFAVLLQMINQVSYYDSYVKSGEYCSNKTFTNIDKPFYELAGKKMGIIGLGKIGNSIARIATGFGMTVSYHSISGQNFNSEYEHLTLETLLKTSDIVSINTPLNELSKSIINYQKLILMKPESILINTARGGIVVETDLANALNNKIIRGACIDVYEQEPFDLNHPYLKISDPSSLILTPHNAWASQESRQRLMNIIIGNILEHLQL
jgi:lactate dehydrogenase-like 2-hydroxyacid dehydrogenase